MPLMQQRQEQAMATMLERSAAAAREAAREVVQQVQGSEMPASTP